MNNNKFPSDSEELSLPPKVEKLINDVNENCELAKLLKDREISFKKNN